MHHKAETAWRIRISTFTGNMLKLQKWFPTFTSCGYEDWKLRLEGCLESEAAETIRGLQYPEVAYNAAKERLVRKHPADWRVILLSEGRKKRNLALHEEEDISFANGHHSKNGWAKRYGKQQRNSSFVTEFCQKHQNRFADVWSQLAGFK